MSIKYTKHAEVRLQLAQALQGRCRVVEMATPSKVIKKLGGAGGSLTLMTETLGPVVSVEEAIAKARKFLEPFQGDLDTDRRVVLGLYWPAGGNPGVAIAVDDTIPRAAA